MKIKSLKINAFGNLKEKEIQLGNHINLVQGSNESGKSTLLKFISNIFYGTSKNKRGKEFSDYDKYKPWQGEEFSGKLTYILDNKMQYEIFRNFNKKNPTIYNEQLEDISKQFTIDKTYGNQFFVEQTNIEEDMFYACFVSMQQEVKLNQNTQNVLVQKIANLAGTGDDTISYQKAIEKLNKKQVEEIGTARSQGRPINIIKEEKFKLQDEIGELEECKERKKQIKQEKEEKKKQLEKIEKTIEVMKKIKLEREKQRLEQEKIKISKTLNKTQKERKKELEEQREKLIQEREELAYNKQENPLTNKRKKGIFLGGMMLSILLQILNIIWLKNAILIVALLLGILACLVGTLLETKKEKQTRKKKQKIKQKEIEATQNLQKELEQIETEIKVLQSNIEEQEKQIQEEEKRINLEQNLIKEKLKKEEIEESQMIENLFHIANLSLELEKIEEEKNHKKLEYHSLELEENSISPKLEKMALWEERLEELKEKEQVLEKDNNAIELAKEMLEIAYQKMKQNITPKLTEKLSNNIQKISNGKYTKVSLQEEKGMIIEKENGEYIEAEKLSIRYN